MSHFTKLDRAQITDPDAFILACAELGFTEVQRGTAAEPLTIKDWAGKAVTVDVAVTAGRYHLALKRNEAGKYDMIADWWGVRGALRAAGRLGDMETDAALQDCLLRTTTKHAIVNRYRRQGFRATVTENADHSINVQLRRA